MVKRSENEIKAYIEGYNACYEQFRECLKKRPLRKAIENMEIYVEVVNNIIGERGITK